MSEINFNKKFDVLEWSALHVLCYSQINTVFIFFTRKINLKNRQKPTATLIYTNNIQYMHFIHLTTSYKYIL